MIQFGCQDGLPYSDYNRGQNYVSPSPMFSNDKVSRSEGYLADVNIVSAARQT